MLILTLTLSVVFLLEWNRLMLLRYLEAGSFFTTYHMDDRSLVFIGGMLMIFSWPLYLGAKIVGWITKRFFVRALIAVLLIGGLVGCVWWGTEKEDRDVTKLTSERELEEQAKKSEPPPVDTTGLDLSVPWDRGTHGPEIDTLQP